MTHIPSRTPRSHAPHAALFVCCTILLGCGEGRFDIAPVSGRVTLDGQPLPDARVAFEPRRRGGEGTSAGPGSFGTTGSDGRFRLKTIDGNSGAVVATHDVTFSTYLAEPDPGADSPKVVRPERVPKHYRENPIPFTVPPEGTDTANFDLNTAHTGPRARRIAQ